MSDGSLMMIGGFKEEGEFPYFLTFDQLTLVFYGNKNSDECVCNCYVLSVLGDSKIELVLGRVSSPNKRSSSPLYQLEAMRTRLAADCG